MIKRLVVDDSGLLGTALSMIGAFVFAAAALIAWAPMLRFERTFLASFACAAASAACAFYRRGAMARRGKARAAITVSARRFRPGDAVRVTMRYEGTPRPRRFDVLAGMSGYVFRVSETRVAERRETLDWKAPFPPAELSFEWTLPKDADPALGWSVWVTTEGGEGWLELHEDVEVAR